MDVIGVLSVLEDEPYRDVKRIWRLIERKYCFVGVQNFNHPNMTFQGGETNNLRQLRRDFQGIVSKIEPFEVEASGLGHFNKKVIFLKVEKSEFLVEMNKAINQFLLNYCERLHPSYTPRRWIPHITLAMDDLTAENFEEAWKELEQLKLAFKQKLHNICIVKRYSPDKIKLVERYELQLRPSTDRFPNSTKLQK